MTGWIEQAGLPPPVADGPLDPALCTGDIYIRWDNSKYAAVGVIVIVALLALFVHRSIWAGRIKRLRNTIATLKG